MRTFAQLETRIQNIHNDTSTKTQTVMRDLIDSELKRVKRRLKPFYEYGSTTITTVASQDNYDLPMDYGKLIEIKVTAGGLDYFPKVIANRGQFNNVIQVLNTSVTSDIPEYVLIDPDSAGYEIVLFPTPATSGNTITVKYHTLPRDLIAADFTDKSAGTVSITNGDTTVTGVGTSFAATDVGRHIRFDDDGYWYKIASFTNTTTIDIEKNFEGTTVSGGNYLIGTVPDMPEDVLEIVEMFVLARLWERREDFSVQGGKSTYYRDRGESRLKKLKIDLEEQYDSPVVNILPDYRGIINPNDYPNNLT